MSYKNIKGVKKQKQAAGLRNRCIFAASFVLLLGGCKTASEPRIAPQSHVAVWTTTADHQLIFSEDRALLTDASAEIEIIVDTTQHYQRMVGFGASITDASAWLIQHTLSAAQREQLLRALFGREADGAGFDFARLTIGASDFSRHHYSLDDVSVGQRDPALQHFSLHENQDAVIPVVQQALAINPQLKIMASPWSAPAWMKTTSHLITGHLLPEHYASYAHYLVRYVEAMEAQDIPVFALTVQNEPDYEPKDYPGMRFNAAERASFIGEHLGPLLMQKRPQLQIFDWDHNWDKPEEPLAVLADTKASTFVSAVAWHCYGGQVGAQSEVRNMHPDKDVYMTECSSGDWEPVRSGGLPLQARSIIEATRHWARGVLFWNLALDENNGPHHGGCATCRGVVTINSETGEVTQTDDYYALAHVSRFVRQGAWRVASTDTGNDVSNVAFVNPDDGSRVLVISNATDKAQTIRVDDDGVVFRQQLPGRSVTTLRWSP